jgi:hypothetical protein
MGGRISGVRRAAFLVALLMSAAAYAYSLGAIAGTGGELRSAVRAQSAERSAPVVYRPATGHHEDCPYRADASRVEL